MIRVPFHLVDDWGRLPAAWDRLQHALTLQYGHERMEAIFDGRDAATNTDLRAWGQLGQWKARVMSPAELIASEVAAGHGLTLQDLRTDTRRKPVAIARQEAMHRLRHIQRDDGTHRYSLMWIARLFGKEDHTTVIHACKAVERRRQA